jgi:hypothetical protein
MRLRYDALQREQERLVAEMHRAIDKREVIHTKHKSAKGAREGEVGRWEVKLIALRNHALVCSLLQLSRFLRRLRQSTAGAVLTRQLPRPSRDRRPCLSKVAGHTLRLVPAYRQAGTVAVQRGRGFHPPFPYVHNRRSFRSKKPLLCAKTLQPSSLKRQSSRLHFKLELKMLPTLPTQCQSEAVLSKHLKTKLLSSSPPLMRASMRSKRESNRLACDHPVCNLRLSISTLSVFSRRRSLRSRDCFSAWKHLRLASYPHFQLKKRRASVIDCERRRLLGTVSEPLSRYDSAFVFSIRSCLLRLYQS